MEHPHILIIGGGLAGLAAGCYAQTSGFRTTIIEHNLALGGVCTAWTRGPYLIDGCIQWLTGGPFAEGYRELAILPAVELRTIDCWLTYRDLVDGSEIRITQDLAALASALARMAPEDAQEVARLMEAAIQFTERAPPLTRAPALQTHRERLHSLWAMRHELGALVHFHKPVAEWASSNLHSAALRRFFVALLPDQAPALLLLMIFGYLQRGWLSRPVGGSARFRDALVEQYGRLGGQARVHATVDEILVRDGHACGVRLADGTIVESDLVVSTASTPETLLRLLGGRHGADAVVRQLREWTLFQPIVIVSLGVELPYEDIPSTLLLNQVSPFDVGGVRNDSLSVRTYNDDSSFAPRGHTVVQVIMKTSYEWWATRGSEYENEKDKVAALALAQLEPHFSGLRAAVRLTDVATPLTYWNQTRSWRGAFEGWTPSARALFSHVEKTCPGLQGFYMAGQWVEPGGGVPTAIHSGRQVVQLICADAHRAFVATRSQG